MTRVAGIIWNRFRGFPQLASRVSQVCNRWNLARHSSCVCRSKGRLLLRFLQNSLTAQGEMLIVPPPPKGGIFNFSWASLGPVRHVTERREGS
ncbi:hypothetical protein FAA86_19070 [Rhizobium rosettiformans W3]|uniref:Uncharacterized protein n=1 Tax=Rhizobium rosettiformans W3 TaxID=538378 RepID=A0A4S8PTJ2_9HYPH|nr:hypothetical protein FAA86_19070 [Rhizobium rosettiformans W3]